MYGYQPNDREKILKLMQIMNTLMNEDYNLDELEKGLDQACKEFTEEGNYYMPPAIKVGGALRILLEDEQAWLAKQRGASAQEGV